MKIKELQQNNLIPQNYLTSYNFPDELENKSGCYAFVDFETDEIIYIGKAYKVRQRIFNYQTPSYRVSNRFDKGKMMGKNTELFLLAWYTPYQAELETLLIDQLKPVYNRQKGICNVKLVRKLYGEKII